MLMGQPVGELIDRASGSLCYDRLSTAWRAKHEQNRCTKVKNSATAIWGRKSRGFERRGEVSNVSPRKPAVDPERSAYGLAIGSALILAEGAGRLAIVNCPGRKR